MFVFKNKFINQIKSNSVNFSRVCKLDSMKTFNNDDINIEEVIRNKVGSDVGKFKSIINI